MAGLGWLVGGCLTRNLAYASALCRHDTGRSRPGWILTRDLHDLTTRLRALVELSLSRERLLQEKRIALARSRDRIRAIRNLSGSSCWEIDLNTGQVIWTDGDEAASERACTLSDVLAHLEPDDRPAFGQALATVRADRHAVRDVVVRTRAGGERISGRRLALRFAAGRADSTRLYALSRAYMEPAREAQTAPPPSSAAAPHASRAAAPTSTAPSRRRSRHLEPSWATRPRAAAEAGAFRPRPCAARCRRIAFGPRADRVLGRPVRRPRPSRSRRPSKAWSR
ncbi:hypothetical protein ACFQWF_27805 [Methylorubrum suomiense]